MRRVKVAHFGFCVHTYTFRAADSTVFNPGAINTTTTLPYFRFMSDTNFCKKRFTAGNATLAISNKALNWPKIVSGLPGKVWRGDGIIPPESSPRSAVPAFETKEP